MVDRQQTVGHGINVCLDVIYDFIAAQARRTPGVWYWSTLIEDQSVNVAIAQFSTSALHDHLQTRGRWNG